MYTERLKLLRERIGLTKTELANIIGIDRSQYGHYENDYITIPIKHSINICNYFHVSLDYICAFTENKQYTNEEIIIDKAKAGARLKEFRKNNKLTQKDLANILNTTFSTISSYELGTNLISTNYLYTICSKYNISADYLMGITN